MGRLRSDGVKREPDLVLEDTNATETMNSHPRASGELDLTKCVRDSSSATRKRVL